MGRHGRSGPAALAEQLSERTRRDSGRTSEAVETSALLEEALLLWVIRLRGG